MKERDLELLQKIAKFEDSNNMEEFRMGWAFRHVGIEGATLSHLFLRGYLDNVFRSNSYTGYRLSELGRALVSSRRQEEESETKPCEPMDVSDGLFDDIIGHDEVKELLKACLLAEKPVHVLLAGPPALAKSLVLWDIE